MTQPQGAALRMAEDVPRPKGSAAEDAALASGGSKVAVVDDDPGVLRSIARLLAIHGYVARAFSSPESLLAEIASFSPHCVIADLSMPGLTGLELQGKLAESDRTYPIIFVTAHGDIRTSVLAMRKGAVDFLTKPFEQAELLDAVRRAIARSTRARLQTERLAQVRKRLGSLTGREIEVYRQVVAGLLNKQIAANLGISEKTVKVHRARVMRKMGMRSVAQLARAAVELGGDAWEQPGLGRSII